MKKKWIIIGGAILIVLVALVLVFVFFVNGGKTLDKITSAKAGGGPLRYEKDAYTVVEVSFTSNSKDGGTHKGVCHVTTNYYKASTASSSGKIFDKYTSEDIPCSFTDCTLTLNGTNNYTYSVVKHNGKQYVKFSKPFMGATSWYIDK